MDEEDKFKDKRKKRNNGFNGNLSLSGENVLDKLKVLDYEISFCRTNNLLPFARNYFAQPPSNSSTQWTNLVALFAWLVKQLGQDFVADKWDDPTTTANKMMLTLKTLRFQLDFPVAKLKQGYGESVCNVLHFLTDKILKDIKVFSFESPIYPSLESFDHAVVDEHGDVGVDEIEEAIESEEDDTGAGANFRATSNDAGSTKQEILENTTDPQFQAAWRTELERVGPRLGSKQTVVGKEWRGHLGEMCKHLDKMSIVVPDCSKSLVELKNGLVVELDKIKCKERLLTGEFDGLVGEYSKVLKVFDELRVMNDSTMSDVDELSNELSSITDTLEESKKKLEDRGNGMTDTSPLHKMRQALKQLNTEIKQHEIQIGVMAHTLMSKRKQNKTNKI